MTTESPDEKVEFALGMTLPTARDKHALLSVARNGMQLERIAHHQGLRETALNLEEGRIVARGWKWRSECSPEELRLAVEK